ncbi:MAG: M20/M25/M40 family metallo-hydrolase, partial [Candidatus Thermofonsia bacterium]
MTGIEIDRAYLQQTAVNLVRINSVNPTLSPDGAGEGEISAYVADELAAMGLAVERYEVAPGRWNVIGTLKGRGNGRTLLWNAHMDTVGVAGMANPFGGEVVNGRLYGRGAQDMKGSLAAMLAAAKALVDSGVTVQGDLLVTAVADEEAHSIGAAEMTARVHADAAIVTEPTDLTLTRAHRGFVWLKVETLGRQAHGSRYTEGIDANIRMGRFLARL